MKNKDVQVKLKSFQGGWSLLASKHEMLYQFKISGKYSKSHTVQTFHGNVAEASFRQWLTHFLPKRYAVTSGYVISPCSDNERMPHFDVIIYDQIESPVFWNEKNPDSSSMGICRAIPAEHVVSVFEVKSSLNSKTAREAVSKLKEINEISDLYQKSNFCSGIIFFELKNNQKYCKSCLPEILKAKDILGFRGVLILEGENIDSDITGRIELCRIKHNMSCTSISRSHFDLFGIPGENNPKRDEMLKRMKERHPGISYTVCYTELETDDIYLMADVTWKYNNFKAFMFELIDIWKGSFEEGKRRIDCTVFPLTGVVPI